MICDSERSVSYEICDTESLEQTRWVTGSPGLGPFLQNHEDYSWAEPDSSGAAHFCMGVIGEGGQTRSLTVTRTQSTSSSPDGVAKKWGRLD